jgi:hypothetical protein
MPGSSWPEIAGERNYRKKIITEVLIPMAAIIGISSLIGTVLSDGIDDSFSIGYLIFSGLISFLIFFLEVYLSAWLITEIAIIMKSNTDSHSIFNLVIFSHVPFFITLSISLIVPQLMFINLFAIYSFILFWKGIEYFTNIRGEVRKSFMVLSSLIIILLYTLLTLIFNNVYDTVLNQFTTFAP